MIAIYPNPFYSFSPTTKISRTSWRQVRTRKLMVSRSLPLVNSMRTLPVSSTQDIPDLNYPHLTAPEIALTQPLMPKTSRIASRLLSTINTDTVPTTPTGCMPSLEDKTTNWWSTSTTTCLRPSLPIKPFHPTRTTDTSTAWVSCPSHKEQNTEHQSLLKLAYSHGSASSSDLLKWLIQLQHEIYLNLL